METLYAARSASITELKKNPNALLHDAKGEAVVILNHNKPAAYLLPAKAYEDLLDIVDEQYLVDLVRKRRENIEEAIEVSLDDL